MANSVKKAEPRSMRPWYHDLLSALSFLLLAVLLGKTVARAIGPLGGLFYLAITGGAAWYFGKAAWLGVVGDRTSGPR